MGLGTGATAAIIGGIGAAGSVGSALISSSAAGHAADTQAGAANYAAALQKQAADDALAFQKQQYAQNQQNIAPWLNVGKSGIYNLSNLLGLKLPGTSIGLNNGGSTSLSSLTGNGGGSAIDPATGATVYQSPSENLAPPDLQNPSDSQGGGQVDPNQVGNGTAGTGDTSTLTVQDPSSYINSSLGAAGSLLTPWTEKFVAPTDVTEQNDPGFQFRLSQGEKALQQSAAARGNLLTGGTAKALTRYGQDYGSNEYNNVYNRAMGQYQQNYNIFKQNQTDQFNKLAAISGVGQTAAGQLSSAGQNTANNVSNILLGSSANIGGQLNNAAAARASGYVGSGNALGGALSNGLGSIGSALTLASLLKAQGGGNIPGLSYDQYVGMGG